MEEKYPRKIYLREKHGYCCYQEECYGKSKRSWLCANKERPTKYAFRAYDEVDEAAYGLWKWAMDNRYRIGMQVRDLYAEGLLRQIADLIGYKEG